MRIITQGILTTQEKSYIKSVQHNFFPHSLKIFQSLESTIMQNSCVFLRHLNTLQQTPQEHVD